MDRTILVLGSNSFSGSHFVSGALDGGYRVLGVSRSPEPDTVFLPYRRKNASDFQFHQADMNSDTDRIMELVLSEKPAYIVNFAALGMVAESWKFPEHWFRTNVLAQVRLHDRLRHCGFLKKFVQVSTPEVYGSVSEVVRESVNYRPSTPYAVSRAAADMSLMTFFATYGFPAVFTRSANVYGPGQQLYRIVPRACLAFLGEGGLPLHGGGVSVRSFIHIRDVVAATLRVMERGEAGEIYHLSTERFVSIRELVETIARIAGIGPDRLGEFVRPAGERPGKDDAYVLDSGKARRELQWNDGISLEDGIEETLRWVRDNIEILRGQPQKYIHRK